MTRVGAPERATHFVRGYDHHDILLAEVWVHGWSTVEIEVDAFRSMSLCARIDVQWLGNPYNSLGPQHPIGHVETMWRKE
jgi:hypothetical protein